MSKGYESFYTGGMSNLDPDASPSIGYRMSANNVGFPGSTQTANQLKEVTNAIKQGVNTFEISMVSPEAADQIPIQHFDEIKAITKLTGVKPSVHGPIMDPAGMGERGYDKDERARTEERFKAVIDKAHLIDPDSNIPIVFHSANSQGGATYSLDDTKTGDERWKLESKGVINKETGEMTMVKNSHMHSLGESTKELEGEGHLITAESSRETINQQQWDTKMNEILMANRYATESFDELAQTAAQSMGEDAFKVKVKTNEDNFKFQNRLGEDGIAALQKAQNFSHHAELKASGMFDTAIRHANPDQKKALIEINDKFREELTEKRKEWKNEGINPVAQLKEQAVLKERYLLAMDNMTGALGPIEQFKDFQDFAAEEAGKTFGNAAWHGYEKYGDKAPVVAIENVFPGMAHAKASDMKQLIDESHKAFVKNAVKSGMDKDQAKEEADKLIGVTWDVGHLNIFKKEGFTDEDLAKQTKTIAKHVKHVHLTDNFGYGDSHLAPGMGNVPIKEHLEELEKTGRLDEMKKIIEAPAVVQHFGISPLPDTLAAFGSPMYGSSEGANWSQSHGMMGNYFSGYGFSNPSVHHSTYGAGFSTLPMELGGNIPGAQSRFSGTPNA